MRGTMGIVVAVVVGACGGGDDPVVDARPHVDAQPVDAAIPRFDARPDAADPAIAGRVCVVDDLRDWTLCQAAGFAGLTVEIRTAATVVATATTADDGTFSILPPAAQPGLRVRVAGTGIVTSGHPYDPADPALDDLVAPTTAHWDAILADSAITPGPGTGHLAVHVTVDGAPAAAITATVSPPSPAGVHYSSIASATTWGTTSTDAHGIVLVPGLPVGPATITASRVAAQSQNQTLPVQVDAITFATIDLVPN